MMDKFEKEYKTIRYNKKTKEVAILKWGKYNLERVGGKPVMDCIRAELKNVNDVSLIKDVLVNIKKEQVRKLFIDEIKRRDIEVNGYVEYKGVKRSEKYKGEDISLYAKPSEEQLRRARELYS